jgi:hypothetical protein
LAHAIRETTATWEREGRAEGEVKPSLGAVEAPCGSRLRLGLMDVASGSWRVEEVAPDRTSATWPAVGTARRTPLGAPGRSRVRDRAQARSTLAKTGLGGLRLPDVLHRLHALVQSASLARGSRLRPARQALRHAREPLATLQTGDPGGPETALARVALVARAAAVRRGARVHGASRRPLEAGALLVPPWRVADATPHPAHEVDKDGQGILYTSGSLS